MSDETTRDPDPKGTFAGGVSVTLPGVPAQYGRGAAYWQERAEQAEAERDQFRAAVAQVRRLCDRTIAVSVHVDAIDQAQDTLAVLARSDLPAAREYAAEHDPRGGLMARDLYVLSPVDTNQIPDDLAYEINLHPQSPTGVYLASRDGQPPIGYVVRFPLNTLAWASCLVCMLIPGADASAINQALDRLVDL